MILSRYRSLVEAERLGGHGAGVEYRLSYGPPGLWEPGAAPLLIMGSSPRELDVGDFPELNSVEFTDYRPETPSHDWVPDPMAVIVIRADTTFFRHNRRLLSELADGREPLGTALEWNTLFTNASPFRAATTEELLRKVPGEAARAAARWRTLLPLMAPRVVICQGKLAFETAWRALSAAETGSGPPAYVTGTPQSHTLGGTTLVRMDHPSLPRYRVPEPAYSYARQAHEAPREHEERAAAWIAHVRATLAAGKLRQIMAPWLDALEDRTEAEMRDASNRLWTYRYWSYSQARYGM
jgi:hypothetical protein